MIQSLHIKEVITLFIMSHTYSKLLQGGVATIVTSLIFLFTFFLTTEVTHAEVTPGDTGNFITTWDTTQPGVTADNQIRIPGTGSGYNYDVYWVNTASSTQTGTTTTTSNVLTLTFPEPGIYRVEIAGAFPRIFFNNGGDRQKILQVNQWGDIAWSSMANAFQRASNLRVPATDAPDLSEVTTMANMFRSASVFNDPVNHWDVSNIELFTNLFRESSNFNQPLYNWDTSNATNMQDMFRGAISFNQPLNDWDVSTVTDMQSMFYNATSFNQPLNDWDVSTVTDMQSMFYNATSFNQPLNDWDVSTVTNMQSMFRGAISFNQPLNNWGTSNVENMSVMFRGYTGNSSILFNVKALNYAFNQDISMWDVSNVTTMARMFDNANNFNQDLSLWNISSLTADTVTPESNLDGMYLMFADTALSQQNQDLILTSWSQQAFTNNITNIPFHIGHKAYSSTGETALNTLRDLGWTITEQYRATYAPSTKGTLIGTGTQLGITNGSSTSPVEIRPDRRCTFERWSDGNTDNPRTDDIITDNLSVTAVINCPSSGGGSTIANRIANLEKYGNQAEADRLRAEYGTTATTQTTTTNTPVSIEDTLANVRTLLEQPLPTDPESQSKTKELLMLLLELVKALSQLMVANALNNDEVNTEGDVSSEAGE
ncbi:MAG: BspA family leucine-rich repeat surface protein [Candidatus Paceibacteria bacterium]